MVFWWQKDEDGSVVDPTISPYGPDVQDLYNKMRVWKAYDRGGRPYVELKPCRGVPKKYKGHYTIAEDELTEVGVIWGEILPAGGKRLLDNETFELIEGGGGGQQTTGRRRSRQATDNLISSSEEEEEQGDAEGEGGEATTAMTRVARTHASGRRRLGETITESTMRRASGNLHYDTASSSSNEEEDKGGRRRPAGDAELEDDEDREKAMLEQYEKFYKKGERGAGGLGVGEDEWTPIVAHSKMVISDPTSSLSRPFENEDFLPPPVGVQDTLLERYGSLSFAELFITLAKPMLDLTVECTNIRLTQRRLQLLTFGEVLQYVGILIGMPLHPFSAEEKFWEGGRIGMVTYTDVKELSGMSYNRFKQVTSNLTFEDYRKVPPDTKEKDKAFKVARLTQTVRNKFTAPSSVGGLDTTKLAGQKVSLDEAMLRFEGLCPVGRAMPNKPIKKGLKLFMLVDYATGMIIDFMLDNGEFSKDSFGHLPWGSTGAVVLSLTEPLFHSKRIVIVDNYYTSPSLAKELLRKNLYMLGTWRKNRGVPDCILLPNKKPTRECPQGTFYLAVNESGDLPMCAIGFMDNAACYLLDTKFGHRPCVVKRRNKSTGKVSHLNVVQAIDDYNTGMGGVDQLDQLRCGRFGITMRGRRKKWTVRYFEGLIDIVKEQAFRMWNVMYSHDPAKELTHYEALSHLQDYVIDRNKNMYVSSNSSSSKGEEENDTSRNTESTTHVLCITPTSIPHYKIDKTTGEQVCRGNRLRQKRCTIKCEVSIGRHTGHGKRCNTRCKHCLKPICSEDCHKSHREEGLCTK